MIKAILAAIMASDIGGTDGLVIPSSYFTLDQVTAVVSVTRLSHLGFDKLLLRHQDNPILENAQKAVEAAAKDMIRKLILGLFY